VVPAARDKLDLRVAKQNVNLCWATVAGAAIDRYNRDRVDDPAARSGRRPDDPRLWQFGNREQHGGVLQGMKGVSRLGNDQQVTVAPLPLHGVSNQPHPTVQHLHGGLTGVLVFRHRRSSGQRNQGLAQDVLVAAVDGPCASAGRSSGCRLHQLTSERIKRQLLHALNVITQSGNRQRHPEARTRSSWATRFIDHPQGISPGRLVS
jgi:hypothetical protein